MTKLAEPGASRGFNPFYLSDRSPKDKGWDKKKAAADVVAQLYQGTEFNKYATKINYCCLRLGFNMAADEEGEEKSKFNSGEFCRIRYCPVCQGRASMVWHAQFFEAIPRILEAYPTYRFIFLTLTVRNMQVEDLKRGIKLLNSGWNRLTQRKIWPAVGYVKSVEVTRERDKETKQFTGYAHPHIHAILMVPSTYFNGKYYISQEQWVKLWQECLKVDYEPSVRVRAIAPRKSTEDKSFKEQMMKAVLETLKYSVKPGDLIGMVGKKLAKQDEQAFKDNQRWLVELTRQTHGSRSKAIVGVFRDYIKEVKINFADLTHGADKENSSKQKGEQVYFSWRNMLQRYVQETDAPDEFLELLAGKPKK